MDHDHDGSGDRQHSGRAHCSIERSNTNMSHIVSIKTEIRDPTALVAACRRLGLSEPVQGTAQLFTSQAEGLIVNLPDWRYPVVIDTDTHQVQYDNYGGQWGNQSELDRLLQAYAVEKAKIESRRAGYTVTEQPLSDGSIKLTIQTGGAV
jgi:hypothetical protein